MQSAFLILTAFAIGSQLTIDITSDSVTVTASPAMLTLARATAALIESLVKRSVSRIQDEIPNAISMVQGAIAQLNPPIADRLEVNGNDLGEIGPVEVFPKPAVAKSISSGAKLNRIKAE